MVASLPRLRVLEHRTFGLLVLRKVLLMIGVLLQLAARLARDCGGMGARGTLLPRLGMIIGRGGVRLVHF